MCVCAQSLKIRSLERRYFLLADIGVLPSVSEVGTAPLERLCVCVLYVNHWERHTSFERQCDFITSICGRIHVAYFSTFLCCLQLFSACMIYTNFVNGKDETRSQG